MSSKISVIEAMLGKVDKLILGGGMVFTFLKARGVCVGDSLVEDDQLELATRLEKMAKERGVQVRECKICIDLKGSIPLGDQGAIGHTVIRYKAIAGLALSPITFSVP